MDLEGRMGGKKLALERVEGGETIVRIYCMKNNMFFNKRENYDETETKANLRNHTTQASTPPLCCILSTISFSDLMLKQGLIKLLSLALNTF